MKKKKVRSYHVFHCADYFTVLKYEKAWSLNFAFFFFFALTCVFVYQMHLCLKKPMLWHWHLTALHGCIVTRQRTTLLCQNGNLEASWILYVTQTGVSHLQTGGKNNWSSFKDSCVLFFFFCLSCICFCIITVYGFCIKCIRVLGCKWNFIHILSKYLL